MGGWRSRRRVKQASKPRRSSRQRTSAQVGHGAVGLDGAHIVVELDADEIAAFFEGGQLALGMPWAAKSPGKRNRAHKKTPPEGDSSGVFKCHRTAQGERQFLPATPRGPLVNGHSFVN